MSSLREPTSANDTAVSSGFPGHTYSGTSEYSHEAHPSYEGNDGIQHPRTPPQQAERHSQAAWDDAENISGQGQNDASFQQQQAALPFVYFSSSAVPNLKKLANTRSLPLGVLMCPFPASSDPRAGPPMLRRAPVRCTKCGAFVSAHCGVQPSTGRWSCGICGEANVSAAEYGAEDLSSCPELVGDAVDYLLPAVGQPLGYYSGHEGGQEPTCVFVLDDTLEEAHLQDLQQSVLRVLRSLSPTTQVSIVTAGSTVAIYDLGLSGIASAETLPGERAPSVDLLRPLLFGTATCVAPIHTCLPIAEAIVMALRPYKAGLPAMERRRCTGAALEVALALLGAGDVASGYAPPVVGRSRGRVVACLGGPTTLGPGSVSLEPSHPNYSYEKSCAMQFLDKLGKRAHKHGITGCGSKATFDVRCSPGVAVTRMVGPLDDAGGVRSFSYRQEELAWGAGGDLAPAPDKDLSPCAVNMAGLDTGHSVAVFLELTEDVPRDSICVQFAVHFANEEGNRVVRVVSKRLPTTGSEAGYLSSIDVDTTAVLIAKRTVMQIKGAEDMASMRQQIDARMKDIAERFGSQVGGIGRKKKWKVPNELAHLPELLYHLRRGPMMGDIVGHEDERAVLRHLSLWADRGAALAITRPQLFIYRSAGIFEEAAPVTLALQSDLALLVDCGTDIFIWVGLALVANETAYAAAAAACQAYAAERARNRFPVPTMRVFKEASSMARFMQSRLVPAHKDSAHAQEAQFPQLRTLDSQALQALQAKLFHTEEASFCEWMAGLGLLPADVPQAATSAQLHSKSTTHSENGYATGGPVSS
eukprot:jgi/Mesvir1/14360/Mv09764-RA.2